MADSTLTTAERILLEELQRRGVRFMVVGMSGALIQGVRGATEDIDLWFEKLSDPRIGEAAKKLGRQEAHDARTRQMWRNCGRSGVRPPWRRTARRVAKLYAGHCPGAHVADCSTRRDARDAHRLRAATFRIDSRRSARGLSASVECWRRLRRARSGARSAASAMGVR